MKMHIKSLRIMVGLAILTVSLARESFAGSTTAAGIVITKAHSTPIGDPLYEYYLQITVYGATNPLLQNGYITISGFTDLSSYAGAGEPTHWSSSLVDDTVTFTYTGCATITTNITYDLMAFRVGPTVELSSPPTPTLTFSGFLNPDSNSPSNSGTIQVSTIPEPSSFLLLSAGSGSLMFALIRHRQRRSKPTARAGN